MEPCLNRLRFHLTYWLQKKLIRFKFRGKGTLLNLLCPPRGTYQIQLFGYVLDCDVSEHIHRSLVVHGYDVEMFRLIRGILRPGDTFVDVGANLGIYSLLASSLVGPTGRVVAFEPNPKTWGKLRRTMETNRITNLEAHNLGLGDTPCTLRLNINPNGDHDNATLLGEPDGPSIAVEVSTLDEMSQALNLAAITYLKIDVEGFEPSVLSGARQLLEARRIKYLQAEFNQPWLERNRSSCEALYRQILAAGFVDLGTAPDFSREIFFDRCFRRVD